VKFIKEKKRSKRELTYSASSIDLSIDISRQINRQVSREINRQGKKVQEIHKHEDMLSNQGGVLTLDFYHTYSIILPSFITIFLSYLPHVTYFCTPR